MSAFEYVMVLVSIVVGLGVTHILGAVGTAIHRLRGTGEPIRLDLAYMTWIAFVFVWLVEFWWWEFKLADLVTEWTFAFYLFIVGYSVTLFLLAVVLVPRDMEGMRDSREHFLAIRGWFFGLLLLANAIDVADTFLKGADWGSRPVYVAYIALTVVVCLIGIRATSQRTQTAIALVLFGAQLIFPFTEMGVLGNW